MSFISYAQNFEDVMIWRALKHVENGIYIDVGANDPTLYSVTRAFYDKGWHGINMEPVAEFHERLKEQRPRDINLQIGAAELKGVFPFYDIPDTGLATSDPEIAQKHRDAGWAVNTIEIPVLPLSEVCQEYASGDIHFLKIDVEGAEKQVLLGMDFKKWRPWLVIVEATTPMSQETAYLEWEYLLTDANYLFVYFDGLNRYYIALEHPELKPAFAVPPNVFDGFVLNADQESKLRSNEAEATARRAQLHAQACQRKSDESAQQAKEADEQARAAQERAREALMQVNEANKQRDDMEKQLTAVLNSTSWQITRPLRAISTALRGRLEK
jgi:FkbM family methyltransferase